MSIVLILENTLNNIGNAIRSRLFPDEYNKRKLYPNEMEDAINSIYDYNVEYMYGIDERRDGQYWCGKLVTSMKNAFYYQHMRREVYPVCGENVKDMGYAYWGCVNTDWGNPDTGSFACGPKVTNMSHCYEMVQGMGLYQPICGDEVTDMSYTYHRCLSYELLEPGTQWGVNASLCLGEWTERYYTNICNAFSFINGWARSTVEEAPPCLHYADALPVCGSKVTNMCSTYKNCWALNQSQPVCGDNVRDFSSTYENCFRMQGKAVCGPNVENMVNTYRGCTSLYGTAACGPLVTNMDGAYTFCYNLDGSPKCGPNVLSMVNAYSGCWNLTGEAVCGDKVRNMSNAYRACHNLATVYVGSRVENANGAFAGCGNATGKAVVNTLNAPYLTDLYETFIGCTGLSSAEVVISAPQSTRDIKIKSMARMFAGCSSLTQLDFRVNTLVENHGTYNTCNFPWQSGDDMFRGCNSLKTAVPAYPGVYCTNMYRNCPIEGNVFWGSILESGKDVFGKPSFSREIDGEYNLLNIYTNVYNVAMNMHPVTGTISESAESFVYDAKDPNNSSIILAKNTVNRRNSSEFVLEKATSDDNTADGIYFLPQYNIRVYYSRSYTFEQFYSR